MRFLVAMVTACEARPIAQFIASTLSHSPIKTHRRHIDTVLQALAFIWESGLAPTYVRGM